MKLSTLEVLYCTSKHTIILKLAIIELKMTMHKIQLMY